MNSVATEDKHRGVIASGAAGGRPNRLLDPLGGKKDEETTYMVGEDQDRQPYAGRSPSSAVHLPPCRPTSLHTCFSSLSSTSDPRCPAYLAMSTFPPAFPFPISTPAPIHVRSIMVGTPSRLYQFRAPFLCIKHCPFTDTLTVVCWTEFTRHRAIREDIKK